MKPVHMCDELGCTRTWTIEVETFGQPILAPKSSTAMKVKLCPPCAEKRGAFELRNHPVPSA